MTAIDLLFAENPSSERLHQAALSVLFRETTLVVRLFGAQVPIVRVEWEPDKGRFDLAVREAEAFLQATAKALDDAASSA